MTIELWREIGRLVREEGMSVRGAARHLGVDHRTAGRALASKSPPSRKPRRRIGKADPFLKILTSILQTHPGLSGRRVFLRVRELGFTGGYSTISRALASLRPVLRPAFQTLRFAPGECAQADWGSAGTIRIGSATRRVSFFVMLLCHSRQLHVELAIGEAREHWLGCHRRALESFGGVPAKIMIDNCKVAVLARPHGGAPVLNPAYADFAAHYGFEIVPCRVRQPQEKGRAENAVKYVKNNFLAGREEVPLEALQAALRDWLDNTANVRVHGTTGRRPVDAFNEEERAALRPLPERPHECAVTRIVMASSQFRVVVDTNRYSVPPKFASIHLELKLRSDRISLYHDGKLIADHPRSYDRNQDFLLPGHACGLAARNRHAREQRLLNDFHSIGPAADRYVVQLRERRLDPSTHMARIIALSHTHGRDAVAAALEDAMELDAFSCEFIVNILEARSRLGSAPGPLHVQRRRDLLDAPSPIPDLDIYQQKKEG